MLFGKEDLEWGTRDFSVTQHLSQTERIKQNPTPLGVYESTEIDQSKRSRSNFCG